MNRAQGECTCVPIRRRLRAETAGGARVSFARQGWSGLPLSDDSVSWSENVVISLVRCASPRTPSCKAQAHDARGQHPLL